MAWRYTCNIPTYITGKDDNGEPVVLYRVNVLFQQLGEDGKGDVSGGSPTDAAPFFVLRRYSQFRHLHDQLKAAFPAVMSGRGMAPPPKHSLALGDKRDALERRRSELERWLWRLVGTAEVARGPQLKAFLEFERALARTQQQQARRRAEQSRLLEGALAADLDLSRSALPSAAPSEAGYSVAAAARRHLAYPGGGASIAGGDDSGSEASGPSSAAPGSSSRAGGPASAVWAAGGGGAGHSGADPRVAPDPRVSAGHFQSRPERHQAPPGGAAAGPWTTGAAAAAGTAASPFGHGAAASSVDAAAAAAGAAAVPQLARLGISLQCRGDVRRLVDVLVQRLETACSEAAAAAGEAVLLRGANRDMARRLGEVEMERAGEGAAAELRVRLAESEASRVSLEQRVAQLEEMLAGRSTAHAAQVSQLQSQLSESRSENTELLRRLAEWDVGASSSSAAEAEAAARRATEETEAARRQSEAARAQADQARTQVEELRQRLVSTETQLVELGQQAEEARAQAAERAALLEAARRQGEQAAELGAQAEGLMGRLRELEQQLVTERTRREQAEAAAAAAAAAAAQPQQQHQAQQAQLERSRADNALLAQEVKRLRTAAAHDREAARVAAAAAAAQLAAVAARVRELEAAAAAAAAAAPTAPLHSGEPGGAKAAGGVKAGDAAAGQGATGLGPGLVAAAAAGQQQQRGSGGGGGMAPQGQVLPNGHGAEAGRHLHNGLI